MESELNNLSEITQYLNIFQSKKGIKTKKSGWLFSDEYLFNDDIASHFIGNVILSYFLTNSTDLFCFDIDLHGSYLNKEIKQLIKLDRYNYITDNFGAPSLIFQSSKSGGLHLYYKINQKIYFEILKAEILKKLNIPESELNKKGIEIRPTPSKSLRLPYAIKEGGAILNYDLKYLFPPVKENAQKCIDFILQSTIYNYFELFNEPPQIADIWLKQKTKKRQFENFKMINRLEKYESEYITELRQGYTNAPICNIIANCYFNGLNESQCLIRLDNILDNSNITRHRDTKAAALKCRIESEYKRLSKNKTNKLTSQFNNNYDNNTDLFKDIKIEKAINELCIYMQPHLQNKQPKHRNRILNTYKSFLNNLYRWTRYIENLTEYDRQVINLNYKCFYHYTKTKKLIPLPYNLLEKWNDRYYSIVKDLQKIGVLKLKQRYFNPFKAKMYNSDAKGICNYYEVNFDI